MIKTFFKNFDQIPKIKVSTNQSFNLVVQRSTSAQPYNLIKFP